MIVIRPSTADDLDDLFRIWHAAVRATHDFLSEDDIAFYAAQVRDAYLPSALFWVAAGSDGVPLGFMGLTGDKMDSLFVGPAFAGQGVGRALVAHALERHPRLRVDVNEQNAGACGFYARMGFRQVGRSEHDDSGRPFPLLHLIHGPA